MPQKRVNYGQMYQKSPSRRRSGQTEESQEFTVEESVDDSPITTHRYRKTVPSKIRIRKGPGLNFHHNGKFVVNDEIDVVKVDNGFGLLSEYELGSNGWVSLDYFELIY